MHFSLCDLLLTLMFTPDLFDSALCCHDNFYMFTRLEVHHISQYTTAIEVVQNVIHKFMHHLISS